MAHPEDERKVFGARLATLRKDAGYTMEQAAEELTKRGYPITKQGLGHWESGRNVPDAFWLRRLSRLYDLPVDAFFSDGGVELETYRLAKQLRDVVRQQEGGALKGASIGDLAPKHKQETKKSPQSR